MWRIFCHIFTRFFFLHFVEFSSGEEGFCFLFPVGEFIVSLSNCPAFKSEKRFGVVKSNWAGP